jgi:protoheme IX farnesyltransferase
VANLARAEEESVSRDSRESVRSPGLARDLFALTKPRITLIVLVTAACGMKLAASTRGVHIPGMRWLYAMLGTSLVVGAANTLNMYWERESDGKMERTKNRPLPAGRMAPSLALFFGLLLAAISLPILFLGVNEMTGLLGLVALGSYVLMYTPMKRHSIRALWVGAIPGAIPPILGWAAVTGRLDLGGVALFAILFVWQIPHFLAISIFRADDYARAGLKVVPVELGDAATNSMTVRYSVVLFAATIWPYFLGIASKAYLVTAILLGLAFVAAAARSYVMKSAQRIRWARGLFAFSILYLVALFTVLVAT